MFLINSRQGSFAAAHLYDEQALSLTYGRCFAEFLEDRSLVRLSLLDSTTCVGLRYGFDTPNLRSFSWKALHENLLCPKAPDLYDLRYLCFPDFPKKRILRQ